MNSFLYLDFTLSLDDSHLDSESEGSPITESDQLEQLIDPLRWFPRPPERVDGSMIGSGESPAHRQTDISVTGGLRWFPRPSEAS
jgi:hypothetical protein